MMPPPVLLLAVCVALGGCSARLAGFHDYRGDGTFTPHAAPSWLCSDGYTVDLGPVDLATAGGVSRRLEGLPPVEATIGLALERSAGAPPPHGAGLRRPAALVEVTLRDGSGHIVLSRHERLTDWTARRRGDDADHAYLFRTGTQIEVPVAPHAARVERFPIGRDDSWGTFFVPRRGARYALHFAVEEPDRAFGGIEARLQVNGVAGCL